MKFTLEQLEKMMEEHNGDLNFMGIDIDSLPEELIVKGSLVLSNCTIDTLPNDIIIGIPD